MLPFFLFGLYEKDGQPLEKVLRDVADTLYRRPQARPYETNNLYAAIMRQDKMEKEVRRIAQRPQTKAHP